MKKHVLRTAKFLAGGALFWVVGAAGTPALALCQLQYTGKAAQMFGSAPRGSFRDLDACNAYRNSRPSFERTNSHCVGCYTTPKSYQQSPGQGTVKQPSGLSARQKALLEQQQREKRENARLKREQEHRERMLELEEIAKKIEFQQNREKMLSQFKDGRGGQRGEKEILEFKPGRVQTTDRDALNVPEYLADVQTALKIHTYSSRLIVVALHPRLRAEVLKKMLKETLKTALYRSAAQIRSQLRSIEAFERDSAYEQQRKREEMQRQELALEKLRDEAYAEAKALAEELRQSEIVQGKKEILPGDAMSRLLQIAETGEW